MQYEYQWKLSYFVLTEAPLAFWSYQILAHFLITENWIINTKLVSVKDTELGPELSAGSEIFIMEKFGIIGSILDGQLKFVAT